MIKPGKFVPGFLMEKSVLQILLFNCYFYEVKIIIEMRLVMKNKFFILVCLFSVLSVCKIIEATPIGTEQSFEIPGFNISPYFDEQVITFFYEPEVRIHINAPAVADFNTELPVGIALFALPNGNTIIICYLIKLIDNKKRSSILKAIIRKVIDLLDKGELGNQRQLYYRQLSRPLEKYWNQVMTGILIFSILGHKLDFYDSMLLITI